MKEHIDLEEQKKFSVAGEGSVKGREEARWVDHEKTCTIVKDSLLHPTGIIIILGIPA